MSSKSLDEQLKQVLHNYAMELHDRIKKARKDAGMTQQDIADACGVKGAAVSQWESSDPEKRTKPKYESLEAIARITNTSVQWLISGGIQEEQGVYSNSQAYTVRVVEWDLSPTTEKVASLDSVGPDSFALRIKSNLMEPVYNDGGYIIVDPAADPQPGDDIVIQHPDSPDVSLKHWQQDGGKDYFIPFSERLPVAERQAGDKILGAVVGVFYRKRRAQ